ncbi:MULTISPECIES: YqeG family HAD IIIA-type phosphatase [unclassified Butyrivibrio]|uniref:YqeG family HAD IIIA-type phosphatase n=1 Tax=unclassified Butyrivibrio TaxID=2639466 RepID=UPI00040A61F6|nr:MULTISPECIES: YqeG family HAD IIIA-type phosphatase [unclassified Butyrivibrio]
MRHLLYPSETSESTYLIPFDKFYDEGYRGVIFDIDNTLVPHGDPADDRAVELFERLHELGYKTMLLSNNKEPRVSPFAKAVESEYIYKADKPLLKGYLKAMERMGTRPENTLFVGDQIFTDVWGANRAGIHTILVDQIDSREEIQIILKRRLEAIVLFFYRRHLKKNNDR